MIREMFKSNLLFCRKHYFPKKGFVWRQSVVIGMEIWEGYAVLCNALRKRKSARPSSIDAWPYLLIPTMAATLKVAKLNA